MSKIDPRLKDPRRLADWRNMDSVRPTRQWRHAWWFAVITILVGLGGIALAVALLVWALLPGID
jgi:hypothetical protein